jgi:hypothetical protein
MLDVFAQSCSNPSLVLSYKAVADDPDAPLQDLSVNGQSLWQIADPVHAEPALYSAMVTAVLSGVEELGGELPASAPKSMRHENVGSVAEALLPGIRSEIRCANRAGHQEYSLTKPANQRKEENSEDGLATEFGLASREVGEVGGVRPPFPFNSGK